MCLSTPQRREMIKPCITSTRSLWFTAWLLSQTINGSVPQGNFQFRRVSPRIQHTGTYKSSEVEEESGRETTVISTLIIATLERNGITSGSSAKDVRTPTPFSRILSSSKDSVLMWVVLCTRFSGAVAITLAYHICTSVKYIMQPGHPTKWPLGSLPALKILWFCDST